MAMISDFDDVYEMFFDKLEADDEFFNYYGIDENEALKLAKERALSLLKSAVMDLNRRVEMEFDLSLNLEDGVFTEEITDEEADILTEIMVLKYFERNLAKLKPKINTFSSSELTILHSPANERTSFINMLDAYREHVLNMVSHYSGKERFSSKKKIVDHTIPEDSDSEG